MAAINLGSHYFFTSIGKLCAGNVCIYIHIRGGFFNVCATNIISSNWRFCDRKNGDSIIKKKTKLLNAHTVVQTKQTSTKNFFFTQIVSNFVLPGKDA